MADRAKIEHGAEVFRRYGKELYPYFGMVTFNGYALESIATPLAFTGAYTGGSALGRFLETCRLWTDTTEPAAMRPGGGTLLLSSPAPGQQLKLLGYRPTDDDIAAMIHHWRYVGYLMAAQAPWYPETATDGFRAQLLVALSETPRPGKDSQDLCRSFMDTYRPADDARGLRQVYAKLRYLAQLGHARFYLGKGNFAMTGLADPGRSRLAPLARVIPNFTRETLRRHIPGVAERIDQTHRQARQEFLSTNLEDGEAKFKPVDKLAR